MENLKTLLTGRLAQLLARYAAFGLGAFAAWMGAKIDVAQLAGDSEILSAVIGAVILLLWDHFYCHKKDGTGNGGVSAGGAALVFVLFLPFIGGCSFTQAGRTVESINACALANQQKRDAIDEGFIADYRARARAEADGLAAAALRAETDAGGKASAKNVQIILETKAEHYAAIEARVVEMRMKIVQANLDMANLLSYNEKLKGYFKQQADTGQLLNQSSAQIGDMLTTFLKGKKASAIPAP